jgi:fatty acid hydroxylase family protein
MDFDTLVALSIALAFPAFMGIEAFIPSGRDMPKVRFWRLIGTAGFIVTFVLNGLLPVLILPYLPNLAVVDLSRWDLWAAIPAVVLTTFLTYQHWNVRTPPWTGYLIQRPEAHMYHHERDVHARNFGDMPVWDMLFGTYKDPSDAPVELGFAEGRARRVGAMIACIDVNRRQGRIRL